MLLKSFLLGLVFSISSMTAAFAGLPAQSFTFEGGSGGPLSITFNSTFTLEVTTTASFYSIYLQFSGINADNTYQSGEFSQRIEFTKNGEESSSSKTFYIVGTAEGDYQVGDLLILLDQGVTEGDSYTFTAGQTITTSGDWNINPALLSATFNVALTADEITSQVSNVLAARNDSASVVPESSTYAAIAGTAILGYAMFRRRKTR